MMKDPLFSDIGSRLSARSGINELMEDLGEAVAGGHRIQMGGGNPAHIPESEALWRERWLEMGETPGQLESTLGDYDGPRGKIQFLEAFSEHLRNAFDWEIGPENLAVFSGSQTAMFLLFNLIGGQCGARRRRVVFPLLPDYIGYGDQAIDPGTFLGVPGAIELRGERGMKYRIDFDRLRLPEDTAMLCLSRPTNPTGNVVSDEEMRQLEVLAQKSDAYLVTDNAYGMPFPGVIHRPAAALWTPHTIHAFSLSKLGLPGTRTGILAAPAPIAAALARMNANLALANPSVGQALVTPLIRSGRLQALCREAIRPYYARRAAHAAATVKAALPSGMDFRLHENEGAFFLWLWLPELKVSASEAYMELKREGLLVIPGDRFTPGLREKWDHPGQCLRLSFGIPEDQVERGAAILGRVVPRLCRQIP